MLREGRINGHPALWLENEFLSVSILPEKGADIYELVYKPRGVDFLLKTPAGLKPPAEMPAQDFLENYEGGWQELFPNPGDPALYEGVELPFHGEAALRSWHVDSEMINNDQLTVSLSLDCQLVPFRLAREMRLLPDEPVLEIKGKITNLADTRKSCLWGHHIVLGGGFLEAGCRMEMPASMIYTPDVLFEPATALLAPGQCVPWPAALTRQPGERTDLRNIPGPAAHIHDDIYIINMQNGWLDVFNPNQKLHFRMEWDVGIFGCIVNWRPLGGSDMPPLTGIYGLGVEPWVSHLSLTDAIQASKALSLPPHGSLATAFRIKIIDENPGT